MNDIALFVNILIFVRSLFAISNLFSSLFSVLKALMTRTPDSLSFISRFSLSSLVCSTWNLGSTRKNDTIIIPSITSSAIPIVHESDTLVFSAFITAPIPMIGAKHASLNIITVACCTICTSFVDLVISEAVEKSLSSAAEKAVTFLKSARLISLDDLAAALDASRLPMIAQTTVAAATAIIISPVCLI